MLVTTDDICRRIAEGGEDALSIVPRPDLEELKERGGASIDLRLGRWFLTVRQSSSPYIDVEEASAIAVGQKRYFVPFDGLFYPAFAG